MDTLAAYESDEGSSKPSKETAGRSLSSLLVNYSDSDSDAVENNVSPGKVDASGTERRPRKSRWGSRSSVGPKSNLNPPLSETSSSVQWPTDYIRKNYGLKEIPPPTSDLVEKFKKMEESRTSDCSWVDRLKTEHEFHNPQFLDNVAKHFGIQEPLGSNMTVKETFSSDDFQVVQLEEQAQMKLQEQFQRTRDAV